MKDFKTLPKMNCGGKVRKYETGGSVQNKLPQIQTESRTFQQQGIPANPTPAQMPAVRMTRIAEAFSNKPTNKRTGGSVKRKK